MLDCRNIPESTPLLRRQRFVSWDLSESENRRQGTRVRQQLEARSMSALLKAIKGLELPLYLAVLRRDAEQQAKRGFIEPSIGHWRPNTRLHWGASWTQGTRRRNSGMSRFDGHRCPGSRLQPKALYPWLAQLSPEMLIEVPNDSRFLREMGSCNQYCAQCDSRPQTIRRSTCTTGFFEACRPHAAQGH